MSLKMMFVILLLAVIATDQVQSDVLKECGTMESCRRRFRSNGTSSSDLPTCTCRNGTCPTDWSSCRNYYKYFKVRVFDEGATSFADFMYCEDLPNLPICTPGQIALETAGVQGWRTLRNVFCRCSDDEPQFYKHALYRSDIFDYITAYVCNSNKVMCAGQGATCYTGISNSTHLDLWFTCDCPSPFKCSILAEGTCTVL